MRTLSTTAFAPTILALVAAGCAPSVPEGRYRCDPSAGQGCPEGMFCRGDGLCWRSPDDDGGADADVPDDGDVPEGVEDIDEVEDVDEVEDIDEVEDVSDGDGDTPVECTLDSDCDDGNACNGAETCNDSFVCVDGRPADEGTDCTTARGVAGYCFLERCRPVTCGDCGVDAGEDCDDCNAIGRDGCEPDCLFTCVLAGECQDGDECNGAEDCSAHNCVPGVPAVDGTACVLDLIEEVCIGGVCGGGGCGDGITQTARGEECDDGNDTDGDGCDGDCTWSCGDSVICDDLSPCNGVEICDLLTHVCLAGTQSSDGTPCLTAAGADGSCRVGLCAGPDCGNATTDADEECDDGNLVPDDGCEGDCTWTCEADIECADARVCNGAETCTIATHACAAGTPPPEGTGCDRDANPDTRDVCVRGFCSLSVCGDAVVDAIRGEQCDDGNTIVGDGCDACSWSCEAAADCEDVEACNGTESCNTAGHICTAGTPLTDGTACTTAGGVAGACRGGSCVRASCGNGVIDPGEECDDGNTVPGDGCERGCTYTCHVADECREVPDNPCTTDTCTANANGQRCVHAPNMLPCVDGNACTSPDACDGEGACAGIVIDGDGDTYGPGAACGGDCNDGERTVYPGATEVCNGVDDDCNGTRDDGAGMVCVRGSTRSCTVAGPTGPCVGTEDCLTTCAWSGACTVGGTELCNAGDDDCDGEIDEGFPCILGSSSSCATACGTTGTRSCGAGCVLGTCVGVEVGCNGCDDDGDGIIDEGFWCPVTSSTTVDLFAVGGSAANDAWAVGASGAILHGDGTSWSSSTSGTASLRGVWAATASAAWAVGDTGTVLRWNGSGWAADSSGVTTDLYSVWGASTDDVWAVGEGGGVLLQRTGGAWATVTSTTVRDVRGVWGTSATNVYMSGFRGTARRWDGAMLLTVATGTNDDLYAVRGTAAGDAWTVGEGGIVLRWNGSRWMPVDSGVTVILRSVWAATAGVAWAVGDGGTILLWDGAAWVPESSGGSSTLHGVWGNPTEVWAVGSGGTILRRRR